MCHESKVPPFLFFEGQRFFFQVVFGVKSGLSTVYFSLGQWAVDFHASFCLGGVFPWSSQGVLQVPNVFPQYVSNSTTLLSPMLCPKVLPFLTYIARPMVRHSILQQQTFILASLQNFSFFFVMGQSKWLFATKKTKNLRTPFIYLNKEGSLFVLFVMFRSPKPWCLLVLLESC